MLTQVNPKLPMRDKPATIAYYQNKLGFTVISDYDDYVLLAKDQVEIHFFLFPNLQIGENYGQVYIRTNDIDLLYESLIKQQVDIHPNGKLQIKPWGQKEFSILDPDNNLLTFSQSV